MELYPAYERSHLLARMPAPERRFLSELADEIRAYDGEFLFKAGEPADRFIVIGRGRVELVSENGIIVDVLGPGELVGVSWFYPDREWSLSARAQHGFIGVVFPAEAVRARCEVDDQLSLIMLEELYSSLHGRLSRARAALTS